MGPWRSESNDPVGWVIANNAGPLTLDGTRSYVVGTGRLAIIDPGPAEASHLENLEKIVASRPVEAVCLTHAHEDHAGCALDASRRFRAPLAASAETLDRLGLDGRALADGDGIRVDGKDRALTALATPGHSSDHLCFLLWPQRWLFTGDLVLGTGSSAVLHPDGKMAAYLTSLLRLVSLRPTRLFPGHGPPADDAVRRLEEYRRHRQERERQILGAIDAGAKSVSEIRDMVYGTLDPVLARAAGAAIEAHLAHIRARDGRVLKVTVDAPAD